MLGHCMCRISAAICTSIGHFSGKEPKEDSRCRDKDDAQVSGNDQNLSEGQLHQSASSHLQMEEEKVVECIELAEMKVRRVSQQVDSKLNADENVVVAMQSVDILHHSIRSVLTVLRLVLTPFIISGIGQAIAGIILNTVTQWEVFQVIPQLVALISPFLGMISNIKSTLASRMANHANDGYMDNWPDLRTILLGNLKVIQCQSSVVSLFTALVSVAVSAVRQETRKEISLQSILVLCSGSVSTSILTNTVLSTLLSLLIIAARKCGINTTNSVLCTLILSILRDASSIGLLALITQALHQANATIWLHIVLLSPTFISPVLAYFAAQNHFTRDAIIYSWLFLLLSVLLEQPGALTMQISFAHHKLASALQPIVNGVAQNIITIQAGHVTVNLKAEVERNDGTLPVMRLRQRIGPFCSKDINSRVSHLLLALSLPAQLFNLSILYILQVRFHYSFSLTVPFIASFTVLIFTQVFIILQLSHVAVFLATKAGYNPDTAAVPLIAALNNLIGNCALTVMFAFLEAVGDPSSMIR